ncbi:hypothetical protein AAVH_19798 [Aphelenchoides avenae]|nr:hypothetical protein AAVH_19798 [Aphelenchus avenae]
MSKDCTKTRKADARQCYNCGEAGHISRDCANRPPLRPNDDPSYSLPIRPIAEVFDEDIAVAQDYKKDKRQMLFTDTFPGRVQVFSDEILRENHAVISRKDVKMVAPASRVRQRFMKALKWEKADKLLVLFQEEIEESRRKMCK